MKMTKRQFEKQHVIELRKVQEYSDRYAVDMQTALTNLINDAYEQYLDDIEYNEEELRREAQAGGW